MFRKVYNALLIVVLLTGFIAVSPVSANPPAPEDPPTPAAGTTDELTLPTQRTKPIDQPNWKDKAILEERQRLLEAGQTAEAAALAQEGTDRVLVLLVEFPETDVITWTEGDTWDPLGIADPNEFTGTVGDCSNIITQTTVFTYTGPVHNEIARPLSPEDRSGDSIWTEDFSKEWFENFMFKEGVNIEYTMQDGTPVFEDFSGQSVRDYYEDLSNGKYTITGDVLGWMPMPHSTQWYDADQCPGARSGASTSRGVIPGAGNARDLVRDAVDYINENIEDFPGFDWKDYDLDGDGIVDRLWIVHAGLGEEDATEMLNRTDYGESAVWSHSSSVTPAYPAGDGISVGPYIMMPENGGIGVFAHEYGHNLGADDLYAYDLGETSAGFWTLMADDWTGYPIGYEPPAVDPWHLDRWGWLEPMVITDTDKVYEFVIGQASEFPNEDGMYRGGKIELPEGEAPLAVPVWDGDYYWWGGKQDLANAMMTTKDTIAIPADAVTPTLSFDLVYDIEAEWDFLWIQASEDGENWTTLTNANTQCVHDNGWVGQLYDFPEDLCGEGMGGFYGYNANFPDPEFQEFDLSAFAGKSIYVRFWYMTDWATSYFGTFVDNVKVADGGTTFFEDDAEGAADLWDYEDPWQVSSGYMTFTHNMYLQWRNTGPNGGYDSALGDARWRFGPANTGLLMWYNNNFYTDNEVFSYLSDWPGYGPKGRMLVVDSHPEPYRDPYMVFSGFDNEGGNVLPRSQMRDAPFTLADTVDFTMKEGYTEQETDFEGRPFEKAFHDALGYYPGAEFTSRGPGYVPARTQWFTKQWDASAAVPATSFYGINAPGLTADDMLRFGCDPVEGGFLSCYGTYLGYDGGTGNPGDYQAQYGWHVEVIEEAADHTWAKVRVWNSALAVDTTVTPDKAAAEVGDTVHYTVKLENTGSAAPVGACVPLDKSHVDFVSGSNSAGTIPLVSCPETGEAMSLAEMQALASDAEVGALGFAISSMPTGSETTFEFDLEVTGWSDYLLGEIQVYAGGETVYTSMTNPEVEVPDKVFLPITSK